jgi:hypothetical protein
VGGEYNMHGREEKFWHENLKERVLRRSMRKWDVNIILILKETGWESVDWIHLAQDVDQWRTLVNTAMNLGFHKLLETS